MCKGMLPYAWLWHIHHTWFKPTWGTRVLDNLDGYDGA